MLRRGYVGLFCWACLLASSLVFISAGTASAQNYKALRRIPVGGEGAWDYLRVDPDAQRIYVTCGSHAMVLQESSGKITGDIQMANAKGVHDLALAHSLIKAFVS